MFQVPRRSHSFTFTVVSCCYASYCTRLLFTLLIIYVYFYYVPGVMNKCRFCSFFTLLYFSLWYYRPHSPVICLLQEKCTSSVMAAISSSNTNFALELYRTLSQTNPSGNIFVSPLSISSALAMVFLGAKEETAAQMAQVSFIAARPDVAL